MRKEQRCPVFLCRNFEFRYLPNYFSVGGFHGANYSHGMAGQIERQVHHSRLSYTPTFCIAKVPFSLTTHPFFSRSQVSCWRHHFHIHPQPIFLCSISRVCSSTLLDLLAIEACPGIFIDYPGDCARLNATDSTQIAWYSRATTTYGRR